MTYVLGLNAYHADAAACLVKDGDLVAAVEEERFRRINELLKFLTLMESLAQRFFESHRGLRAAVELLAQEE